MTPSSQAATTGASSGDKVSPHLNDILAIPKIVDRLPAWVREPFRRFVRLRQRNWPAKRVKRSTYQICSILVPMIQYLNEEGECRDWTDWSVRLIEAYIDDKLRQGKAANTINLHLYLFRSFCQFVIDEGYPLPHILRRIKVLDAPRGLPRPLSDEQVYRLEACIKDAINQAPRELSRKVAVRDLACFYLMWHCGLRVSEVSELLMQDLDLSGRKVFIRHSKEGKDRALYISQTTAAVLGGYLADRRRPNSPFVFAGRYGPLTTRNIRDRLKTYGEQCDVPVTPHRLRHTFASQMLAAGMSITSLQRYLGHEKLDTTLVYAKVSDPMLQKDYYRGAATFDPASADLARRVLDLSQRDELLQLIAELKYTGLEPRQRKEVLEQMETILTQSVQDGDAEGDST